MDLTAPSRLASRDLFDESVGGLFARPVRTALTVLGTVVGIAALVATIGLSRTAGNRIVGRFDELAATEIVVTSKPPSPGGAPTALPWDAEQRMERLNGVVAAGTLTTINVGDALVRTSRVSDPRRQTSFNLSVAAASPGAFAAVRADLRNGRLFDEAHSERGDRVAVLGPSAALRLGIDGVEQMPAITIGDDIYLVIGILDGVARQPDLLGSVIIPEGTAAATFRLASPERVVIETRIGATTLISTQVPNALKPDNPRALRVAVPPEPKRVREAVQNDLNLMFILLGGVALVVGAIGIANVTLVSVMERTGEIGLRRALGASRRHIAEQFLLESATMGAIGGVLGASIGTLVVVAVAARESWTPVLDPFVPLAAPLVGAAIGFVSGAYPSVRAARMEPVDALRSGT
ncbi:MAG: ABC transporter permease [Actinomycetota bacterium]|nr:ABC transporter permease [Actinomycetota bacterium]